MKQKLCIIAGPTAVGKTDISILIAQKLCGEIISADSAQVYKYMDIGTAKVSKDDMKGINHYMIDEVYPDENFSVAVFKEKAECYIKDINSRGKLPIIVGGTGLYINSLLNNLEFTNSIIDIDFRNKMRQIASEKGNEYVHEMLKSIDEVSYKRLHPNDLKRVIRALEVYNHTGKPISYFQMLSKQQPCKYEYAYICLNMDRSRLYNRIELRVDKMIKEGLVDEVEKLLKMGYSKKLTSLQALGYKEIIDYLDGDYSLEEAINTLKKNTRHYAKRQLTWFRNDERVFWINIDNYFSINAMAENMIRYIAGKISLI
ncbi:tRNA dimethylallyltransferase [Lutispora thermophila DSM 19022]|uniref:tRNA dimethylallyltransferase n=1 Tax=Lutispora thermophila DSM 19022 TaxID=1122184 RepID=A0A1M6F954_9FIRM|nr:tRNA (adenosine(37)-N6)-dimethylallyltransferase MiaA [Lutispora thermophila]SHI94202.1 tRNA dimethylallyltransferase [Lutispora thermophila DSM 19022]